MSESANIPHARKQLHQSAVTIGQRNHDIGFGQVTSADVDQGQDEGGEGESAQTQRSWVGELSLCRGSVETRLELTAKGRESSGIPGVEVRQRVAAILMTSLLRAVHRGPGGCSMISARGSVVLLVEIGVCICGRHLGLCHCNQG